MKSDSIYWSLSAEEFWYLIFPTLFRSAFVNLPDQFKEKLVKKLEDRCTFQSLYKPVQEISTDDALRMYHFQLQQENKQSHQRSKATVSSAIEDFDCNKLDFFFKELMLLVSESSEIKASVDVVKGEEEEWPWCWSTWRDRSNSLTSEFSGQIVIFWWPQIAMKRTEPLLHCSIIYFEILLQKNRFQISEYWLFFHWNCAVIFGNVESTHGLIIISFRNAILFHCVWCWAWPFFFLLVLHTVNISIRCFSNNNDRIWWEVNQVALYWNEWDTIFKLIQTTLTLFSFLFSE